MRYTPSGLGRDVFSVAVTTAAGRRPDNAARDETEWFTVVAWDKLAETCNQLITKGRKVYIEGRLQTRSWEGQDGQKRSRSEVIAATMLLLDSRPQGGGAPKMSRVPDPTRWSPTTSPSK